MDKKINIREIIFALKSLRAKYPNRLKKSSQDWDDLAEKISQSWDIFVMPRCESEWEESFLPGKLVETENYFRPFIGRPTFLVPISERDGLFGTSREVRVIYIICPDHPGSTDNVEVYYSPEHHYSVEFFTE